MRSDVELVLGGQIYTGWLAVRIERSIEQLAGAFELRVATEPEPGAALPQALRPGLACEVRVDGTPLIAGYVDDVEAQLDAQRTELTVRGRDAAGDLVDCAALPPPNDFEQIPLPALAAVLCVPFGIAVTDRVGGLEPLAAFTLEPGETVYEALERAARLAGVLIVSDGRGGLQIAREGTERAPTALLRGANILRAHVALSHRERFGLYVVRGQDAGPSLSGAPLVGPESRVQDAGVGRYRPLLVSAEAGLLPGRYAERGFWERNVRRGRSARVTITTVGWHHAAGLWEPNTRVYVEDGTLGIAEELHLAGVVFSRNEQGTLAELTLYRPGAFERLALPPETVPMWANMGGGAS
jgi:prophage tail gpP-like protein